jgi:uncharacterized protein YecE (DUF72 family)
MKGPELCIGTSGWNYRSWRQGFYGALPQRLWLHHCAELFDGIEINNTFYRYPSPQTQLRWLEQTPPEFPFAVKGHRGVTHFGRLIEPADRLARLNDGLRTLLPRITAMLWQLPRTLQKDVPRLDRFGAALQRLWPQTRHVMEFRHESWFDDETAAVLSAHRLSNCISDAHDWPRWDAVTTDLVYVRLHGHTRTYASSYSAAALDAWAAKLRRWRRESRIVHVYFDNDAEGAAPRNALALLRRMRPGQRGTVRRTTALRHGAPAADGQDLASG